MKDNRNVKPMSRKDKKNVNGYVLKINIYSWRIGVGPDAYNNNNKKKQKQKRICVSLRHIARHLYFMYISGDDMAVVLKKPNLTQIQNECISRCQTKAARTGLIWANDKQTH